MYVDRYGETVLLKPSSNGLGVLVWALPIAALVLGAGGHRARAAPVAAPAPARRVRGGRGARRAGAGADSDRRDRGPSQEEERDFLLRSLDDLESERAAGNIDDETYQRLHDDYTARAAITVRAMQRRARTTRRGDVDPPPTSRRHRFLVIGGIVVFAVIAATTMAFALGARLPGDTITGRHAQRRQTSREGPAAAALEAAVAAKNPSRRRGAPRAGPVPARPAGPRRRARGLPGRGRRSRPPNARAVRVQRLDHPAPGLSRTRRSSCSTRPSTVDPSYPDAHFFRGFILLRDKKDPKAAIPEFQQYLVAAPDSTARRPGAQPARRGGQGRQD